jgi:hypothetical protein
MDILSRFAFAYALISLGSHFLLVALADIRLSLQCWLGFLFLTFVAPTRSSVYIPPALFPFFGFLFLLFPCSGFHQQRISPIQTKVLPRVALKLLRNETMIYITMLHTYIAFANFVTPYFLI